jgi:hypothetical protein
MEDDLAISGLFPGREAAIVEQLRNRPWDFVYPGHGVEFAAGDGSAAP